MLVPRVIDTFHFYLLPLLPNDCDQTNLQILPTAPILLFSTSLYLKLVPLLSAICVQAKVDLFLSLIFSGPLHIYGHCPCSNADSPLFQMLNFFLLLLPLLVATADDFYQLLGVKKVTKSLNGYHLRS